MLSNTVKPVEYQVVVIDDDPAAIELICDALGDEGVRVHGVSDPSAGLEAVARLHPHMVLLDLIMPGVAGLELLERILGIDSAIEVILVTGHYSTDSAVEAIQKGASDYMIKPVSLDRLRLKVRQNIEDLQRRRETSRLESELLHAFQFEGMVGRSPALLEVISRIRRVAPHFQTVLVTGETGTGKELVARALHNLGPRRPAPFVVVNCAAITETLFESELFGYVRGAFTGALQDRPGLIQSASGGTVFLDEIGEMPLPTQAKLLRVIQNREIQKLGSSTSSTVDVRFIAATNRSLEQMAKEKVFREDLYYRLSAVEIKLPSLLERMEDLRLLEQHFLAGCAARYAKPALHLTRRAEAQLSRYTWPGNVRELENVLNSCAMLIEGDEIDVHDLPERIRRPLPHAGIEALISLDEVQRRHARSVLELLGGNRVRAAEVLGISRTTLYKLVQEETSAAAIQTAAAAPRL